MATSQQIAQTKFHHQAHQHGIEVTVPTQDNAIDPPPTITIKIGTITMIIGTDIGLAGRDPIPTVIATGVTVKETHEGVVLGPITNPHTTAHHTTETQVHTATNGTLHTEDLHPTEVFPGITVYPDHVHHTNMTAKHHQNCLGALTKQPRKNKNRKYKQVTIDDPPS